MINFHYHLLFLFFGQIQSELGDSFFLVSDPESSGSPPRRVPTPVPVNWTANNASSSSAQLNSLSVEDNEKAGDDYGFKYRAMPSAPPKHVEEVKVLPLGLPRLNTGIGYFAYGIYDKLVCPTI